MVTRRQPLGFGVPEQINQHGYITIPPSTTKVWPVM